MKSCRSGREVKLRGPAAANGALRGSGFLSPAYDVRNNRLVLRVCVDVLLDLDRKDLGLAHLTVEKLHDAAELCGDLVSNEYQADPISRQVRLDFRPIPIGVADAESSLKGCRGVYPLTLALGLKPSLEKVNLPKRGRVGRVVEHLRNHLPPGSRIGAALDLHQRRHSPSVKEQVIQ